MLALTGPDAREATAEDGGSSSGGVTFSHTRCAGETSKEGVLYDEDGASPFTHSLFL